MGDPCDCGDPVCGHCYPGGAAVDAAIDRAVAELLRSALRAEEIAVAVRIGIRSVLEMRELTVGRVQEALDVERAYLREEFAQERDKIAQEARHDLERSQDLDRASGGYPEGPEPAPHG